MTHFAGSHPPINPLPVGVGSARSRLGKPIPMPAFPNHDWTNVDLPPLQSSRRIGCVRRSRRPRHPMTDEDRPERRLAASYGDGCRRLLPAHAVGRGWRRSRPLLPSEQATQNQVKQHRGRIANTAGDSVLAEFGSAVEAVSCAMALQDELSKHSHSSDLQVRIGIHIGDVVDKGGDLFGTAVNVAARLEGIAQPGGIAVSSAVREDVAGKLPSTFVDLGLKTLKNIEHPVRVYSVFATGRPIAETAPRAREALPLTQQALHRRPAFENMSGDPDQEYFADGMVEEIITALSRFRWSLRHRTELQLRLQGSSRGR